MHYLAPKMGTTSVFIKTLTKTHWGNEDCWERAENGGRRPKAGWGSWGGGSKPHQLGGLGAL